MAKFKCPRPGCGWEAKTVRVMAVVTVVPGVHCPNCDSEGLRMEGEGSSYTYVCGSCSERWRAFPCPECATSISTPKGLFG